jgi:hypothetical protein
MRTSRTRTQSSLVAGAMPTPFRWAGWTLGESSGYERIHPQIVRRIRATNTPGSWVYT